MRRVYHLLAWYFDYVRNYHNARIDERKKSEGTDKNGKYVQTSRMCGNIVSKELRMCVCVFMFLYIKCNEFFI